MHCAGKFSGLFGHVHGAHEILSQSLSVFFSSNSYCSKHSSDSLIFQIESVGKSYPGDALAVERATLLYFICWFTVKNNHYQATRYLLTTILLILTISLTRHTLNLSSNACNAWLAKGCDLHCICLCYFSFDQF